jgi:CO/xanthine dehydrogenase FAD-binding subunit
MLLHELSKKELPSTLRTQATIGGTIAERNGESILLSGFLALNAEIETDREAWTPLGQFLQPGPHQGIITAVKFDIPALDSKTSFRSVGRTPMDVPIVSGIGYAQSNGNLQISLTGVNEIPVLVNSVDDIENLDPKGDFRGSSEYRKHLASVIYSRIEEEVQA